MLLIPAERRIDWANPPLITLLLILVNCFVFLVLQADDRQYEQQALVHYMESELPAIEFPAWQAYLEEQQRFDEAEQVQRFLDDPPDPDESWDGVIIYFSLHSDDAFLEQLDNEQIITPRHPRYQEWLEARQTHGQIRTRSLTHSYGFTPAEPTATTAVSHMFLHGSLMHLVGNMIILLMVGFVVEMVLGKAAYLVSYLLGGLFAVALHWAIEPSSAIPLVGASGAISAVMGAFTVLYGLRRIRFFYLVLFYFGFVRAPAIAMLPVWLAIEFYQWWTDEVGNIAYFAHIGGLLGGALIAGLHRQFGGPLNTDFMDEQHEQAQERDEHARALALVEKLRIAEAREVLRQLLRDKPADRQLLQQLYALARFEPASDQYHETAREILSLPETDPDTVRLVHQTFVDYLATARPGIRLPASQYVDLAETFVRGGYLSEAENILKLLLKQQRVSRRVPGIALSLAKARLKEQARERAGEWLRTVSRRFPGTGEAQQARKLLEWNTKPRE